MAVETNLIADRLGITRQALQRRLASAWFVAIKMALSTFKHHI